MTKKKKVAIVGFASSSRDQAPQDDDFEVWGLNSLYLRVNSKWDRWFEMHSTKDLPGVYPETWREHKKWLQDFPGPIYMHEEMDEFPNSAKFPIEEMRPKFGDYYTSTVAFMLALAIHEGFGEIHVYGVDMVGDDEYGHQRANAEYFIGYAKGAGIKVYVPPQSALLTAGEAYGLPGRDTDFSAFQTDVKRRLIELESMQEQYLEQNKHVVQGIHRMDGRLEAYENALNWHNTSNGDFGKLADEKMGEASTEREGLIGKLDTILGRIKECDGAMREGDYYLSRLRSYSRGGALILGDKHQQQEGG
jgi:hypothetical protein